MAQFQEIYGPKEEGLILQVQTSTTIHSKSPSSVIEVQFRDEKIHKPTRLNLSIPDRIKAKRSSIDKIRLKNERIININFQNQIRSYFLRTYE